MAKVGDVVESVGEHGFGSPFTQVLLGLGALFVAPMLIPQLRPAARGLVRAGLTVSDKLKEVFAEAREQWSDLAAEARTDMRASETRAPAERAGAAKTAARKAAGEKGTTARRTAIKRAPKRAA